MRNRINMAVLKDRHIVLWLDFLIPLAILGIGTWLIRYYFWDIKLSRLFYLGNSKWWGMYNPLCDFMYDYGTIPALALSIIALGIFIVSFFFHNFYKWRRKCLFLMLVMLLGPGLIVNGVMKEYWGRPSPRNINFFGGKFAYEKPLEIDLSSPGKSFPSGHSAMAFYFFTLYFLVRGKRKKWTAITFIFALIYGFFMGFVRIAQGGHFLSDILWSGGIVYLSSALCYYLLKINSALELTSSQ